MSSNAKILFASGGFRNLRSFKLARVCYDVTVRFVELYIPANSRTCDQMVQAARSGVQNIAEGSVASATSKKTELKLTNVARASLMELRIDYEDYLRQNNEVQWDDGNFLRTDFISRKVASNKMFKAFVDYALEQDLSVKVRSCPLKSVIVANAAIILIDAAIFCLSRQIRRLAADFEKTGGFTERMYKTRINH